MIANFKTFIALPRLAALWSACVVVIGSVLFPSPCVASPKPAVEVAECDAIFVELVKYHMFYELGPKSRTILGLDNGGYNYAGWNAVQKRARSLPIEQKCRLALLVMMALPLDGEYAQRFSYFFGPDRVAVGKALRKFKRSEIDSMASAAARDSKAKDEAVESFLAYRDKWRTPLTEVQINAFR